MLFPMDSDVPMSSSLGSAVSAPLGFAPINLPVLQVSLFSTGPMWPNQVQPDFDGFREDQLEDQRSLSLSTTVPGDHSSPVSLALPPELVVN